MDNEKGGQKIFASSPPFPHAHLSYLMGALDGAPPPLDPLCPFEAPPCEGIARDDDPEDDESPPLEWPELPELPYPPDREPNSVLIERRSVARLTAPRSLPVTTRGEVCAPLVVAPFPPWLREPPL